MKPPKPPNTLPSTTGSEYHLIASAHQALVEIFKAIPPNHPGIKEANSAMVYLKAATEDCRSHYAICYSVYWQKAAISVRIDLSEQLDQKRRNITWNLKKFQDWWKKFEAANRDYLDDWMSEYYEKLPSVRASNIPNLGEMMRSEATLRAKNSLRQLHKCQQLYSQKLLEASK
jgi:hypothetical protein